MNQVDAEKGPEMSRSKTHIFVCYGVISYEAACWIAARVPSRDKLAFFCTFQPQRRHEPGHAQVFLHHGERRKGEWSKVRGLCEWFQGALHDFNQTEHQECILYAPHVAEVPGNYFAYCDPRIIARQLLPDGLINYVDRRIEGEGFEARLRSRLRVWARKFWASFFGFQYHGLYSGHLTQYDELNWDATWSLGAQGLLSISGELKIVPLLSHENQERAGSRESSEVQALVDKPSLQNNQTSQAALHRVLFIDQELGEIVEPPLEGELRARIVQRLQAMQAEGSEIFYKAHPRGQDRRESLSEQVPGLQAYESTGFLEGAIAAGGIDTVIGFFSTTLLLLASSHELQAMAVLPEPRRAKRPQYVVEIIEAMSSSGVEVEVLSR